LFNLAKGCLGANWFFLVFIAFLFSFIVVVTPRLSDRVYILIHYRENTFPVLVGNAWVVQSQSNSLLLTAFHCLETPYNKHKNLDNLYIIDSISLNADETVNLSPFPPIPVEVFNGDTISDVAVLRANLSFPRFIELCPLDSFPSVHNEDKVKSYHCPCQSFMEFVTA
jgi:hypothetical protein